MKKSLLTLAVIGIVFGLNLNAFARSEGFTAVHIEADSGYVADTDSHEIRRPVYAVDANDTAGEFDTLSDKPVILRACYPSESGSGVSHCSADNPQDARAACAQNNKDENGNPIDQTGIGCAGGLGGSPTDFICKCNTADSSN